MMLSTLTLGQQTFDGRIALVDSNSEPLCKWCLNTGPIPRLVPECQQLVRSTFGIELVNDEDTGEFQYMLCDPCIEKLNDCYNFRCQIEQSQTRYRSVIIKADVEELLQSSKYFDLDETKTNILKCEYPSDDDITENFEDIPTISPEKPKRKILIKQRNTKYIKKDGEIKSLSKERRKNASVKSENQIEITPDNALTIATRNLLENEADGSKERQRNNIKLLSKADFKQYRRLYYRIRYAKSIPFKLDKSALNCEMCGETFSTHKNLVSHMSNHYPNHICDLCGKAFVVKEQLVGHMRTHSMEKLDCKICGKILKKSSMTRHLRTHTGNNGVYACPSCPERFVSFSTRLNHMAEKHNIDIFRYNCTICEKKFHLANSLTKHIRRCHFQELNVSCSECGKGFFDKKSLKNHMVKHTGEKKYQCEVCLKSFGRKCTIVEHLKIHSNIKEHKCPYCDKAFTQKCTLKGHLKIHERVQMNSLEKL